MRRVDDFDEVRTLSAGGRVWRATLPVADGLVYTTVAAPGVCRLATANGPSTGAYLVHRGSLPTEAWVNGSLDTLAAHGQANAPLDVEPVTVDGEGALTVFFRGHTEPVKLVITCLA